MRKSYQEIDKIYFWTATIHHWNILLQSDENKKIILDSFTYLTTNGLVDLYAFVIMPNHIHLIWKNKKMNKKEMPWVSFLKYTAHLLFKNLKKENETYSYVVKAKNKNHEIWKRDSFAVELYTKKIMLGKLNYIHANPKAGRWDLSIDNLSYQYSSAKFYELGIDEFGFLQDIYDEFGHI